MALPINELEVRTIKGSAVHSKRMQRRFSMEGRLASLDEVPDFHDPFSDLNLFLFKHLKRALPNLGFPKRWTIKLQEGLIQAIAPEFQKRFPLYRLGVSALKKAFEKLLSYLEVVQGEKGAFTQDGKLSVNFLIKENFKQLSAYAPPSFLHPTHYAHQLALRISECLAVLEGKAPKIEPLAQLIWSVQRHLVKGLTPETTRTHLDAHDEVDQILVKAILEITSKDPTITEQDLELALKESLLVKSELPPFPTFEQMEASIAALLAERHYPNSPLHSLVTQAQKENMCAFFKRHLLAAKKSVESKEYTSIVRRLLALYTLASNLPKDIGDKEVLLAIKAITPFPSPKRPPLSQALYAFLAAELVIRQSDPSSASIHEELLAAYKEATGLPPIEDQNLLEMLIWKQIASIEHVLQTLPYIVGQRIEEESAGILLDHPNQKFSTLVFKTSALFKKIKLLATLPKEQLATKIRSWCAQSDMLLKWITLDTNTPLMHLVQKACSEKGAPPPPNALCSEVMCAYLNKYPQMGPFAHHLQRRIQTLYKYLFFKELGGPDATSLERFVSWHSLLLQERGSLAVDQGQELADIVSSRVTLVPSSLFERKVEEESAERKERQA